MQTEVSPVKHHVTCGTISWSDSSYSRWHSLKSPILFNQDKEKVFITWQALSLIMPPLLLLQLLVLVTRFFLQPAAGSVNWFLPSPPHLILFHFLIITFLWWHLMPYVWDVFHIVHLTYDMLDGVYGIVFHAENQVVKASLTEII